MRAIILCGGFGTRLRPITGDQIPKCMVKGWFKPGMREVPWLRIVIDNLKSQGITDITLALHYKAEVFTEYFGNTLKYKIESEPLGTGGAIKNCLEESDEKNPILVLNGDTYTKCDFAEMQKIHRSPLTIAIDEETGNHAGAYIINKSLFTGAPCGAFSFEKWIKSKHKRIYKIPYYIDIGTPEQYEKAQL